MGYYEENTMKKYKIALIHNIISPYRVPLFVGLSSHPLIELSVFFCADTHKMRKWDVIKSESYNYEVLSGFTLELSNIIYHINPSIISKLIKGKYDAVIISGNPDFTTHISFVVSKLFKIPTIWWSEGIESSQSKLGKMINPVTKYIVKNVDAVVVPGSLSRDFHIKLGATPEKVFVAPNVVDNEFYIEYSSKYKQNKDELKESLNLKPKKIILFVGRIVELKGIEYLINAYSKIKNEYDDVGLVLVGDGNIRKNLERHCTENDIKDVYFTGWLADDKITYYSVADIFVLPTLKDVWGLVVNEAMCCGLPVISTTAAGSSFDMIKNGENGYVVDPANEKQLYAAITKIILNEELQQKMSHGSLAIIKKQFTLNSMVDGFVSAVKYSCDERR